MSVKRFLLYILAVFLLLMLDFAAVYGYIAVTSPNGFPIVSSEQSVAALALLTVELFLWWFVDFRRNKQAYRLPAAPVQRDVPQSARTLDRHSLRSGAGHPAQRIRPKQVLVPLVSVLAFVLGGIAAIYLGFHFFVFNFEYRGNPAVFGEEYRDAKVVLSEYDRQYTRGFFVLETADGEQRVLSFDGSDLHPGRYRTPPTEWYSVPTIGRIVLNVYRNFWARLEIVLMTLFSPVAFAVSLFVSHRIQPKDRGSGKPAQ